MPSDTAGAPAASSKLKTLLKRLLSTAVLWAVVLGALFFGNQLTAAVAVLLVLNVISFFGLMEFFDLAEAREVPCFRRYIITAGFLFLGLLGWGLAAWPPFSSLAFVRSAEVTLLGLIAVGLFVRRLVWPELARGLEATAVSALGFIYVPWMLGFIEKIYFVGGSNGAWWLLYFILVTKASDMGAYSIGSLIGRHKMISRISPGKTWEGFGGAILGATLASLTFAHFAQNYLTGMTAVHAAILGVLLGVGAVAGDLVESLFKREAGVKDSGRYFPGIGGVLDLVDSLLFNAPIMYAYVVWLMISK